MSNTFYFWMRCVLFISIVDHKFSLGATIPPPPEKTTTPTTEKTTANEQGEKAEEELEEPAEPEEKLELDMSGVIEGENDPPLPMGDSDKEVASLTRFYSELCSVCFFLNLSWETISIAHSETCIIIEL